MKELKIKLN